MCMSTNSQTPRVIRAHGRPTDPALLSRKEYCVPYEESYEGDLLTNFCKLSPRT
jgi:hypothetical protein